MNELAPWLANPWQQWQQSQQLGRSGHALLVHGPSGVGKSQLAAHIGASLLCESNRNGEPACGLCKQCRLLNNGAHPDRIELHPDGNQIKIDAVRQLIEALAATGHQSQQRVVIIHNAELLNHAAANALLKTLEEPMPGVNLLLVCNSADKLLPTIISRCQKLMVPQPAWKQVAEFLGNDSEQLSSWPYWLELLGGPYQIQKWMENEGLNRVTQWRKWWRESLKSGLLEPQLSSVEADLAPLVVKVLYFELLFIGRKQPQWLASRYQATKKVSDTAQWLERQSGINLTSVMQQLIVELRQ